MLDFSDASFTYICTSYGHYCDHNIELSYGRDWLLQQKRKITTTVPLHGQFPATWNAYAWKCDGRVKSWQDLHHSLLRAHHVPWIFWYIGCVFGRGDGSCIDPQRHWLSFACASTRPCPRARHGEIYGVVNESNPNRELCWYPWVHRCSFEKSLLWGSLANLLPKRW